MLLVTISLPFAAALAALACGAGPAARRAGLVALGSALGVALLGGVLWARFGEAGAVATFAVPWLAEPRMEAALLVDRLAAFFVLLVGLVGLAITQYARVYLHEEATGGFWALLLAFTGGMLGLVLSDSLLLLFVFWEITTVTSALLIGWHSEEPEARRGGLQAFLVTGTGSLALLAGLLLLGLRTGLWRVSELWAAGPRLVADPGHALPLVLMLVGALAKSAQFPFHFWLPGAMAAPAPVTAFLHSATMVKAGVFLVARLHPAFADSPVWQPLLATAGVATFVVAGWSALRSDDVKRMLAYATCSYLGLLVAQYGLTPRGASHDELVSIANHATYKSALFLLAGWVEKATGTRDLRHLAPQKWRLHSPTGAVLAAVGVLAMSGVPLLLGFFAKELFFLTVLDARSVAGALLAVTGSALAFAYSLRILVEIFGGQEPPVRPPDAHPVSPWLLAVPALLLVPQVLGGLAPYVFLRPLLDPRSDVPAGPAFWHHVDAELAMSLAALGLGLVVFLGRGRLRRVPRGAGAESLAHRLERGVLAGSAWLGQAVQAGGHPRHVASVLVFGLVAAGAAALLGGGPLPDPGAGADVLLFALPALLAVAGAVATVRARGRVSKVVALAVSGYGVALFYVTARAPDLALTQFLVETLTLVLLLLAFRQLPRLGPDTRARRRKAAHAAVALAGGVAVAALAWAAGSSPAPFPAGAEQMRLAQPAGHGRNAVNVILVDFRAADTLGEITVLGIAALGALALLAARAEHAWRRP